MAGEISLPIPYPNLVQAYFANLYEHLPSLSSSRDTLIVEWKDRDRRNWEDMDSALGSLSQQSLQEQMLTR